MLSQYIQFLAPFYDYILGRKPSPKGDYFAFSYSSLSQLAKSPLHFFLYVVESKFAPVERETDAQLVGKVLHNIVLDRHCMGRNLRYMPLEEWCGVSRATKEGKALWSEYEARMQQAKADSPDVDFVSPAIWAKAQALAYALTGCYTYNGRLHYVNPQANELLIGAIDTEKVFAYVCPDYGVPIRGVIDFIGRDADGAIYLADLKSLRAVDGKSLYYSIRDSGYDLQAYLYARAVQIMYKTTPAASYLICAGEDTHSNIVKFSQLEMIAARKKYEAAMANFSSALLEGSPTAFLQSYNYEND